MMTGNPTLSDDVKVTQADKRIADRANAMSLKDGAAHSAATIAAALARLSTRDDGLREAVKPFANYHGDLPDYDDPLRPVYESGIQYAVELLAKVLKVDDYEVCDGTGDFDDDLGGTMFNIVLEAMPKDADGDALHPDQVRALLSPQPEQSAPAGDGEGLALKAAVESLQNQSVDDPVTFYLTNECGMAVIAALRTQSQPILTDEVDSVRDLVARLYCASGCDCCRDTETWETTADELARRFNIPRYDDGGYNWYSVRDAALASMGEG